MSTSSNGTFIDGLFITLLFGNVLLVAMLSPFVNSGFVESDLPGQEVNSLSGFRFDNFGLNLSTTREIFSLVGLAINFIVESVTGLFGFVGLVFGVYGNLGLFGSVLLALNGIVGAFFLFEHSETIINMISGIINAVGQLLPFTQKLRKLSYILFLGLILLSSISIIENVLAEPPIFLCIFVLCEDGSEFIFCGPPQALNGVLHNVCKNG